MLDLGWNERRYTGGKWRVVINYLLSLSTHVPELLHARPLLTEPSPLIQGLALGHLHVFQYFLNACKFELLHRLLPETLSDLLALWTISNSDEA